jgi:hypothetical protein
MGVSYTIILQYNWTRQAMVLDNSDNIILAGYTADLYNLFTSIGQDGSINWAWALNNDTAGGAIYSLNLLSDGGLLALSSNIENDDKRAHVDTVYACILPIFYILTILASFFKIDENGLGCQADFDGVHLKLDDHAGVATTGNIFVTDGSWTVTQLANPVATSMTLRPTITVGCRNSTFVVTFVDIL